MSQDLRLRALEIVLAGLRAVSPELLLRRALLAEGDALRVVCADVVHRVILEPGGRLRLLAVGKAAAPMALEAHHILGPRIDAGLVVTKVGFGLPDLPFPCHECGHPVPDQRGLAAAEAAEALLRGLHPRDLVLVLVSGGASALLPAPVAGIALADKQALATQMLRADMDIHEINRVRKALSRLKGGGLARCAAPAQVVGLYLSDVPGDDLGSIGSGPTVPQAVDRRGAVALLEARGIWARTPPAVRRVLAAPTPSLPELARPPLNGLIGCNRDLVRAVAAAARAAGYEVRADERPVTGRVELALKELRSRWQASCADLTPGAGHGPRCLIMGGEATVQVTGKGQGGRCQELAARMLPHLDSRTCFIALGSDGNDGSTDAAGGAVDGGVWRDVQARGLPYAEWLADNDSYRLLGETGTLVRTGPTRNNLMDVYAFFGAS